MATNYHSRTAAGRAGFSFIELLVVVLLIAIFAAATTPSYVAAIHSYRVDNAALRVIADLQFARSEAQRTSQSRTVQFDSTSNQFELIGVADRDRPREVYAVQLAAEPYGTRIVSVTLGGDEEVVFDMFGRPDNIGTKGIIKLRSGDSVRDVEIATDGTATKINP